MCRIKFILFLIPSSHPHIYLPLFLIGHHHPVTCSDYAVCLPCLLFLTPLSLYLLLWVGFHVSFLQVCLAISLMLQNFMICLEIKTTLLSCGSPRLERSSLFCWIFAASLRLSLVISCRKVRVALLFSDSSLCCHGCYPIGLQCFLCMIILSCQTVSYWKPGRENLSLTIT